MFIQENQEKILVLSFKQQLSGNNTQYTHTIILHPKILFSKNQQLNILSLLKKKISNQNYHFLTIKSPCNRALNYNILKKKILLYIYYFKVYKIRRLTTLMGMELKVNFIFTLFNF